MKILKYINSASFVLLVSTVLFVPLFVFRGGFGPYLASKQLLFVVLMSALALLFGVKLILEKKGAIYLTFLHKPLLFLVGAFILSAAFGEKTNWLFGRNDYFVLSLSLLICFILLTFFVVQNTINEFRREALIGTLGVAGIVASVVYLARAFFGIEILKVIQTGLWNPVDPANTNFAVFLLVIFLVSVGEVIRFGGDRNWRVVHYVSAALSALALFTLGFKFAWGLAAFGLALQLLIALKHQGLFQKWSVYVTGALMAAFVLSFFVGPVRTAHPVPVEVALGMSPSWSIVSDSLVTGVPHFLFGSGPGSFNVSFLKFRDTSFNFSSETANLRFNFPGNSFFAVAGENGVASVLAFVAIILSVIVAVYFTLKEYGAKEIIEVDVQEGFVEVDDIKTENTELASSLMFAVPWVTLTAGMGLFYYSFVLWTLWWLLLGLTVISFAFVNPKLIRVVEVDLQSLLNQKYAPEATALVLAMIFILVNVFNVRVFLADQWLTAAVAAQDFATAESNLKKSISYRSGYDTYHSALSRVYFNDAADKTKSTSPDLRAISETLSNSVLEARKATELSPKNVEFWIKMADIYDGSTALVPEAADYAAKAIQKAKELDPNNAFLSERLAKTYETAGKNDLALKEYENAIGLKGDLWSSYISISNIYEKQNDPNKALQTFETVLKSIPANIEVRYNYGRLYYNRNKPGDREFAEKIWLSILNDNPNYSNALYSLGLLNELRGERRKALEYYYKVRDLNPTNTDVKSKIVKLER